MENKMKKLLVGGEKRKKNNEKRLPGGGGEPVINNEMNEKILEWIFEQRAKGLRVKAKAMHDEIYATDPRFRDIFTASRG